MPSGPDAFDVSRLLKISSVSACDMFMEANLEFVLYTIFGLRVIYVYNVCVIYAYMFGLR